MTACRILIVEDNPDTAASLALLLELDGYWVRISHDGCEALRLVAEYRPHVVLLDIGLPGLSGYEVCSRLRADPAHRDIVILAITAWGQEKDRKRSAGAGFDGHLVKPVAHATLLAHVEHWCRARKLDV